MRGSSLLPASVWEKCKDPVFLFLHKHFHSCPSSRWCHPAISSSIVPFSSWPQSLPASGSFPMGSWLTCIYTIIIVYYILYTIYYFSSEPVKLLSRVRLFATPWTVAYQAPPSMGFSRQECWSGLPFPSPGDLPYPGIEPRFPTLEADALTAKPPGKHKT